MDDRTLRIAGAFAWAMVGLPMVLTPPGLSWRLAVWLGCYALFAVLLWRRRGPVVTAVAGLCVFPMVLVLCNGFEGALLVLCAIQLGGPPRAALAVIGGWTALFTLGISLHWTPRSAVLLVPPYLGLQVLGLALSRVLLRAEREERLRERLRIARDLHDALGHHLTALSLHLEVAGHEAPGAPSVETARSITRLLLSDVRDVVGTLGREPPGDLAASLRALAAGVPTPRVHLELPQPLAPDPEGADVILRTVQEIVTNAARHAQAKNLWIDVTDRDGALEIRARDDGIGAEAPRDGHGLRGMRARIERLGGTLALDTGPGSGFQLVAVVPRT